MIYQCFQKKKKILKQNSIESFSTNYKNKIKLFFLIKNIRRNLIFTSKDTLKILIIKKFKNFYKTY